MCNEDCFNCPFDDCRDEERKTKGAQATYYARNRARLLAYQNEYNRRFRNKGAAEIRKKDRGGVTA